VTRCVASATHDHGFESPDFIRKTPTPNPGLTWILSSQDISEPSVIADDVQTGFPNGVALPQGIRAVCDYLDEHGYPISGCFEINLRGKEVIASWFRNDEQMKEQFAVFGNGSTGSTYALWLRETRNSEQAPIVLLGSEGEFLVLATNADEFCRLLGCGYDELEWDNLTQPPQHWAETSGLRDWLKSRCNFNFPSTGEEIVKTAQERYPDFGDVVRKWQDDNL